MLYRQQDLKVCYFKFYYNKPILTHSFIVFLYEIEQLEDKNVQRSTKFRHDMQRFLNLDTPLDPFTSENNNSDVHYPGSSIRICDDKYKNLRSLLTRQGNVTRKWIEENFMQSNDVFVSNRPHFLKSLEKWGVDPCVGNV